METWIFVVISAVWKLQISWVKTFRGRGDGSTHVTETAHIFFDTTNQNIQVEPPEMELMYLAGRLIPSWCFFSDPSEKYAKVYLDHFPQG